ncbi:MAG: ABC transporter permease [Bacteroidia bacterium]|nr:ABC transporter permease [Bacteroidia bacterium]
MIKHYLKIAFRISRKAGSISIINILGLSIGLAICMIIFIYVRFETSYDRFHNDNDRIFRVEEESNQHSNGARRARCTHFIGVALEEMDESEAVGRINTWRASTVRFEDIAYKEDKICMVSPGIFNVFTFNVIEGNPSTEISRPNTVVLTETLRRRYFGDSTALRKIVKIDTALFEVVGVVEDIPSNSHFRPDLMISYSTRVSAEEMPYNMMTYGMSIYTYIKLKPNVDPLLFDNKIRNIPAQIAGDILKESGETISCFLDPVRNIHLNSEVIDDFGTHGNKSFLYLISAIGILVLITTCFNYMNLSTARFINRTKELGVRKTFGAGERQLGIQFLGESLFTVFIAHFIAMALVETGLIFINNIVQVQLKVPYLDPKFALFLISIIIVTGLVAGSYPAFMLSSVNPVAVMKGSKTPGKGSHSFRRVLVICQFMISIFLVIATFLISRQLNYMKNSPLGFIKEQKLVFRLPEGKVTPDNYERVKSTFEENPSVIETTVSSSVPGRWMYGWQYWPSGEKATNSHIINCMQADYDFIRLYGLEMIAGEPLDPELSQQENTGMIINEAAIKEFGWNSPEEALTKTFFDRDLRIRGVFKDYHFRGKNQEIGPMGFFLMGEDYRYITLVFSESMASDVLKEARKKYKELFPDSAEDYFFLDDDFNRQYEKEQTTGNLVLIFTIFAVLIACLGLYGMTAYTLESKQHIYSIMKVNGASSKRIYLDVLKEFMIWIGVAFVIVSPVIYFAGTKWLMQFPYRTNLSIWIFVFPGMIVLAITFITISLETYKIFKLNPVDTIRNE